MEEINQVTPVKIHLRTAIKMDAQHDEFEFHETGQLIRMAGGNDYLRYVEHQEGQATPVKLKLADDSVHLTRQGARETNLLFKRAGTTVSHYRTEYGVIRLDVITQKLDNALDLDQQTGSLQIHYQLKNGDQLLGSYRLQLQFESWYCIV